MALKVNSEHRIKFLGLCSLCQHGFICSKVLHRLFVIFVEMAEKATCRPAAAGKYGTGCKLGMIATTFLRADKLIAFLFGDHSVPHIS